MSDRRGPAFAFWLDYLDARGGLWERSGDSVLMMLPDQLATTHDLPESTLVTDDPDIAREDGVLFLGAGHPEIGKAADAVITTGDVAAITLPPPAKPMSTPDLLARIRDRVHIDHGRIDATAAPVRAHRPTLRLGELVSHTVSAEERFTEVAECVIDASSRIPWPEDSAARLRDAATTGTWSGRDVRSNDLVPALGVARQIIDEAATARGRTLATGADAERTAEITRANDYYAAALAAIDKRRADADSERTGMLDARAQATIAERDHRLAEINEKYGHRHELRPYRLHLIDLPAWRVATDVRRGDRRWPLVMDYIPLLGTVAPLRCPTCDAHAPLVATKTNLACIACAPTKSSVPPAPAAPKPPTPKPAAGRPEKASTAVPTAKDKGPRPAASLKQNSPPTKASAPKPATQPVRLVMPGKAEERKALDFWQLVAADEYRKLARLIAPDSPLAALTRLYGSSGPLYGIGVPAGATPVNVSCGNYDSPVAGDRGGTSGTLHTQHEQFRFRLLWSPDRRLDEIFPYSGPWHLGRIAGMYRPVTAPPPAHGNLDGVARLLFTHTTASHGLTFTARALTAWWRLPDPDALLARFPPQVLAAAVDRAVRYWSGAAGATYPDVARAFHADETAVRKATPVLQKQLQLSTTRNW